jgi:gas vesicle protein
MNVNKQEHSYVMSQAGGFFAGLLAGVLIGAGMMLLLAPQSGKKTRAKIQHEGMELRDRVTETVEDAVAQTRDKADRIATRVHKQAEELQQRGQDALDEQMDVMSHVVEAEKTAVRNISKD